MLCLRARGFGLRDKFADAMKGLITAEEAHDYPTQPQPPLMTTNMHGDLVPVPEKESAAPAAPVPFEYPPPFHYDGGTLRCTPINVQKRRKKGAKDEDGDYIALKFAGGKIEGKDTIFCWHASMFDALLGAVNQDCQMVVEVSHGYADVVEILSIGGVDYVKPELTQQLEDSLDQTDDIPF
jgi:hypothetical protein